MLVYCFWEKDYLGNHSLRLAGCSQLNFWRGNFVNAPNDYPFMNTLFRALLLILVSSSLVGSVFAAESTNTVINANRLTYLDESDPFYVGLNFPKLTTPQWVGDRGVDAVVTLAVDDMRDPQKYETFLRPILERLKKIDHRAALSIMTVAVKPDAPELQTWVQEGVSIEVHTLTHPCPLLQKGNFTNAANVVYGGVDLLSKIPGNTPVAFRMPCCDSMNTPSPRFFAEIFNQTSVAGNFLSLDSSVMNLSTPADLALPREWVQEADGKERFRKYLPVTTNSVVKKSMASFSTTIEDYPYPYVIGKLAWEFPPMAPSDWEGFNLQGPFNPATLADMETGLDIAVRKQGTFNLVFHPHGWMRNDQIVELIDHAVKQHGKKVKFLNFHEAWERLTQNMLAGQPLRAANGEDNGVRILDLNNDGYMDVVIGNEELCQTRLWNPKTKKWEESNFPVQITEVAEDGHHRETGVRFGIVNADGYPSMLVRNEHIAGAWHFDGHEWVADKSLLAGLQVDGQAIYTSKGHKDRGVRFRDVNKDGRCELIVGNESQNAVLSWNEAEKKWKKLDYALPKGAAIVDAEGRDNGVRFVDVNQDGFEDVIFSNETGYGLYLYISNPRPNLGWYEGWSHNSRSGKRGDPGEIPMIVRAGPQRNNGAWFRNGSMWVQNEDVAHLPDVVDRRSYKQLLAFEVPPPKSPEESLKSIRVRPGFKVELVAAEPLTMDPVAFEWGADGKLWVVEMGDYPLGLDNHGKPGGIVRYLEDTKGDGHYDKSTVFLSGIGFPNGVTPWKKGVLISAAPEIFYAEDTDGDGKADTHKTLFAGFREGNQQHRLNGFDYGLDNWLYGANGDSGGMVKSIMTGKVVDITGRDFRFRPDTGEFETETGRTQFGRHRDDWGNWFGNNNPTWLWHDYVAERYLVRNPHLAVRNIRIELANYPDSKRVYAISKPMERFNQGDTFGYVTSGNSPSPYRDDLFGPEFATTVFASEPVYNTIHREVLEQDGVSFKSHRAPGEEHSEFIASTDNWFRPVMSKTGPDGALYFADMYRFVLEHPEWIAPESLAALDLRAGSDKGRIYRVYPEGVTLRKIPRLDKLSTVELVAAMDSPNGWQRDTAQRLLVDIQDKAAVVPLENLVKHGARPKTRLQALCTLDGLGALTPELIMAALQDQHPSVRENAVRVSEPFLRALSGGKPAALESLANALLKHVDDPEIRVRYQLAFSLGEWKDVRAGVALGRIALKDQADEHLVMAVMSSAVPHVAEIVSTVMSETKRVHASPALVEQLLGLAAAMNQEPALLAGLKAVAGSASQPVWQMSALAGFLDALERRNLPLAKFQTNAGPELAAGIKELGNVFERARKLILDPQAPAAEREVAVRLLGRGPTNQKQDLGLLVSLLNSQTPGSLQSAAMATLGKVHSADVADFLLASWKNYSPGVRAQALGLLFGRKESIEKLLTVIELGNIPAGQISRAYQQKLIAHKDKEISERAGKLFSAVTRDRQKVVKNYEVVNQLAGDPEKGHQFFRQNCIVCHRLRGEGNEVGPDLGMITSKSVDVLLTAILDPNQAVEERYVAYTAVTKSGNEISGVVAAETPTSLTIKTAAGTEEVILRNDLQQLTSSGMSLMPEGFENFFKPQDLADLISYIASGNVVGK